MRAVLLLAVVVLLLVLLVRPVPAGAVLQRAPLPPAPRPPPPSTPLSGPAVGAGGPPRGGYSKATGPGAIERGARDATELGCEAAALAYGIPVPPGGCGLLGKVGGKGAVYAVKGGRAVGSAASAGARKLRRLF